MSGKLFSAVDRPHVSVLAQLHHHLFLCQLAMLAGGVQELHAAYLEAVSAIFEKGVACHRHQRCYTSKKTGKQKWTTLEMWPIAV